MKCDGLAIEFAVDVAEAVVREYGVVGEWSFLAPCLALPDAHALKNESVDLLKGLIVAEWLGEVRYGANVFRPVAVEGLEVSREFHEEIFAWKRKRFKWCPRGFGRKFLRYGVLRTQNRSDSVTSF